MTVSPRMPRFLILCLAPAALLPGALQAQVQAQPQAQIQARPQPGDFNSLLARGDAFDACYQTQRALACYLAAEKLEAQPQSPSRATSSQAGLLGRIAKEYCDSMADTDAKGEKRACCERALGYAQRAVAADPANSMAEVLVAICYGRLAKLVDNRTKIAYSKQVKQHAEKALALDPKNELGHYVLGAWNLELANLGTFQRTAAKWIYGGVPAASNEEAVAHLLQAIALNPKRPGSYVELGRAYAAQGKTAEARALIYKGLAMPNPGKSDPDLIPRAQTALKKLRD